jgi:anthranilate synthase/aminodeoxychorismate synthase-like glutamine amidotransferase
MLLMIDNYDSFTYNLVQYFGELGQEVKVFRNDKITIQEAVNFNPEYLVISPGPCSPKEAGISIDIIKHFKEKIPILGVCLGTSSYWRSFWCKNRKG